MSDISMHEMRTQEDAAAMMAVRNEVRGFMTHNQNEITEQEQREWFAETYTPARWRKQMIGFVAMLDAQPAGYGLISERDDRMWVSGGLVEDARGKGNGRKLFHFLTEFTHGYLKHDEVWLDVQRGNDRAIQLYRSLGYMVMEDSADLLIMRHQQLEEAA